MKKVFLSVISALAGFLAYAQEKATDINVDIDKGGGGGAWYAAPWVWIVGGAVFILLLVALLRGNRRTDA